MNHTTVSFIPSDRFSAEEIVVFGLLGLLIVLGNAVSIIMFWRRRFFMERSSILLINLSVADLIVGLVVIFTAIVGNLFLQDGSNGVKNIPITIIIPFDVFSGLSSISFLTAIAVEKTHTLLRPLRHVTTATRNYVIFISSL